MSDNSNSNTYTGRVKWFNNKAGYGFITVTDSSTASDVVKSGTDVFVHYSKISLANTQYSYLIQGEYVQFQLEFFETGAHKIQASNVTGINGGKLMCETRREFRIARNSYREQSVSQPESSSSTPQTPVGPPPTRRAPRAPSGQDRTTGGRGEARTTGGRGQARTTGGRGRGGRGKAPMNSQDSQA